LVSGTPPYFWYHTYGVDVYPPGAGNLNVGEYHSYLYSAVEANRQYMQGVNISNQGYNNAITPAHVEYAYAPLNNADFAVVHVHGQWPDCVTDDSPWWLSYSGVPRQSRLALGGAGWGFLKWLWAASCSNFDVRWQHINIQPVHMLPSLECFYGFATGGYGPRYFDGVGGEGLPRYLAQGITVQQTSLQGCGSGDAYKRVRFFYRPPQGLTTPLRKNNNLMVKVSAPGSPYQLKGQMAVRLGALPRVDSASWGPGETIATINVYGSMGAPREYRVRLQRNGQPAYLGDFPGLDAYDLYLYFSNCQADLAVTDLAFFYYPLDDAGVQDTMRVRVNCYASTLQGVHALMGYSNVASITLTKTRFAPFMTKWIQQSMSTATAFLSQEQQDVGFAEGISRTAPAIALPYGPTGDPYRYLWETWQSATDDPAPGGACMIVWCMPYFDQGYYWVEQ